MTDRDYDYPLAETQVIWDPYDSPELPPVELVRLGFEDEDDNRYNSSWGVCNQDFVEASDEEKLNMLMRQFVHLTVNDGVTPLCVHKAFMQIPEYRRALAEHGALDPNLV